MQEKDNTTENLPENVPENSAVDDTTAQNVAEEGIAETVTPPNRVELKGGGRAWIRYLITAVVLAALVVLVGWARGCFTQTDTRTLIGCWCDAFFIPSVLAIGFGLLVLVSKGGAFDIFVYAAKAFFRLFKKDPIDRKYGGYYKYQQEQRKKKRSFWYLIIVGGAYMLVALALLIVFYKI